MQLPTGGLFLFFHVIVVILFATCTEYAAPSGAIPNYHMFQDVHIMIAIGFGFLMAFLYRGAFTTIGHSFMIMTFVAFWTILNVGFWHRAVGENSEWKKISIGMQQLIEADFGAGAILISFGALVGRCSADQLLIMALLEVIFYTINESIAVQRFKVADIGGSMIIHAFGAYFGMAVSFALETGNTARQAIYDKYQKHNGSSKTSDTFAMIGTLFLWCFWPSFNAALSGARQEITIVNTFLSISASCLVSFYLIGLIKKGKFHMVEIQNSTLAGGVAIGAVANMHVEPYGAIIIGSIAGAVSVLGYQFLSDRLPVKDTCGVHNLHGMPGVIGAIASIIVAGSLGEDKYNFGATTAGDVFARTPFDQGKLALNQFYTLLVTLGLSLGGGLITGAVLRVLPGLGLKRYYNDTEEWEAVDEDEEIREIEAEGKEEELKSVEPTA